MSVTASQVKELRERTGLGMMECKKALVDAGGDIELAIEEMRKAGQAKAAKKAGRVAAEGIIAVKISDDQKSGILLEINSETDFAAKDQSFLAFVTKVTDHALTVNVDNLNDLLASELDGITVEENCKNLVATIGEKIHVRRFSRMQVEGDMIIGGYSHSGRIGVLVILEGGDNVLAKDIAMHIAASNPQVVDPSQLSQDVLAKEKEIFIAQAADSGKPAEIVEKMVEGRLRKFTGEVSLTGQPFVKDPNITVGQLLKDKQAKVVEFVRFEVGEGIEKQVTDFAAEVMAQVKG
ncbi:MAG: elongation factor Ts [Gammaproteobacteria bacterium]|nr:elongation factor Ts [Gammaproteobacteria bacterium]